MRNIYILIILIFLISSCSIQKRKYRKGYHVEVFENEPKEKTIKIKETYNVKKIEKKEINNTLIKKRLFKISLPKIYFPEWSFESTHGLGSSNRLNGLSIVMDQNICGFGYYYEGGNTTIEYLNTLNNEIFTENTPYYSYGLYVDILKFTSYKKGSIKLGCSLYKNFRYSFEYNLKTIDMINHHAIIYFGINGLITRKDYDKGRWDYYYDDYGDLQAKNMDNFGDRLLSINLTIGIKFLVSKETNYK